MKAIVTIGTTILVSCSLALTSSGVLAQDEIHIDGSTTVGPIIDAFVGAFEKSPQFNVKFSVKKTGSGDGAAALIDGRCHIAAMSRFMKKDEYNKAVAAGKMPVPFTICMDGVCLIVHPTNPVRNLTKAQVKAIYTGQVTNWKEVGGADMPIVAISRDTSSGTYEVFQQLVVEPEKLGTKVEYANANPQIFTRVSTTPGAIGYVGLGFVKTGVKAVSYENVMPTKQTISRGTYKISRPLYLFTDGYPELGSTLMQFCNFFFTEEGQDIIEAKGFIPLTSY
ncbi:MAG: phosphate ABC transporter substrate-binding protein [Planctomycetaceae bacterium]|nr:phosphate ABC transporter substrate-binding protein [Planctomycetaceae bacterium]